MKKIILSTLIILFLFGCSNTGTVDKVTVTNNNVPEQEKVVMLKIAGMTWAARCVALVQQTLSEVSGVKEVSVDYSSKIAVVRGNQELDPQKLLKALERTGRYYATIME